ncbi:DUF5988 family protein [Streptomyces sp. NRRL F-2664]|uniref:DUF5988 family protein n=1 Tax=Streptomyces sp. NRRL F-2664 TaxID=1463842 RepID=UPI0004CBB5C8|nr:DUF5988 family protein [Streptomyces sp. NRRL F-2664]
MIEATVPFCLSGGPPELAEDPPAPTRQDPTRLTIRWLNGYEHYEFDVAASKASGCRVYQWIYRTKIAE